MSQVPDTLARFQGRLEQETIQEERDSDKNDGSLFVVRVGLAS